MSYEKQQRILEAQAEHCVREGQRLFQSIKGATEAEARALYTTAYASSITALSTAMANADAAENARRGR